MMAVSILGMIIVFLLYTITNKESYNQKDMEDAGYVLVPHMYKFEEYGVPQARHRLIIVGIRNDIDVTYKVPSTEPYKGVDNTCKTAIEVPPISANAFNHE